MEVSLQRGKLQVGECVGQKHSSIGMNKKNEWQVWMRLYGSDMSDYPTPKLRVGDTVQVPKYKNIFGRGFEPNFFEEILR